MIISSRLRYGFIHWLAACILSKIFEYWTFSALVQCSYTCAPRVFFCCCCWKIVLKCFDERFCFLFFFFSLHPLRSMFPNQGIHEVYTWTSLMAVTSMHRNQSSTGECLLKADYLSTIMVISIQPRPQPRQVPTRESGEIRESFGVMSSQFFGQRASVCAAKFNPFGGGDGGTLFWNVLHWPSVSRKHQIEFETISVIVVHSHCPASYG